VDSLVKAIEAADGVWSVVAIAIIGLYVLIYRFGGQLLTHVKENTEITQAASRKASEISENISTNHDSTGIGHAVDLLADAISELRSEVRTVRSEAQATRLEAQSTCEEVLGLRTDFTIHLKQARELVARVKHIENVQAGGESNARST
jgi:hypothetical protein